MARIDVLKYLSLWLLPTRLKTESTLLAKTIPEFGLFALIMALGLAFLQSVVSSAGAAVRRPLWMAFAEPMAWGQLAFLLVAYASLTPSFLLDDFSVLYVANNSNSMLPWYYKLTAMWASHEGSVLLWSLILSGWGFAVSLLPHHLPRDMLARGGLSEADTPIEVIIDRVVVTRLVLKR